MKKDKFINILLYSLSSIMMILLMIRIGREYALTGPFLIVYIAMVLLTIYVIIGHGRKIYQKYKKYPL